MKSYVLKSNFKEDIQNFLNLKHSTGYKYTTSQILIEQFDNFCFCKYQDKNVLDEEIGMNWAKPRKDESASSLQNRIVVVREFAKYLISLNKNAFVIPTTYIPKKNKYKSYIYSSKELEKIFDVIDNKKFKCTYRTSYIVFPVLFRIFYGCGLRISEALNLKVKDVDLQNGIIAVYEAKNDNDRLVPITDNLKNLMLVYADKMHQNSCDTDYFFYLKNSKTPIIKSTLRFSFARIMKSACIEKNKNINPRIHDFRHTFAVNCLKKFIRENKDLTVYLPILKTYMGHSKFISTEYYLKLTNDMFPDILEKVNLYINDAIPRIGGNNEE